MDGNGKSLIAGEIRTPNGELTLQIPAGVFIWNAAGAAQPYLAAVPVSGIAPDSPGSILIRAYDMGPEGATFTPSISLTFKYSGEEVPVGCHDYDLYIGWWDGSQWVRLQSVIDTTSMTVTAVIGHFSRFALLVTVTATDILLPETVPQENTPVDPQQLLESISFEIMPDFSDDGALSSININYRFSTAVQGWNQDAVTLMVARDDKEIETCYFSLNSDDSQGVLQYKPGVAWQNGTYILTMAIEQAGEFLQVTTKAIEINVMQAVPSTPVVPVVRWQILTQLIGWSMALSIILIGILLIRFYRLKSVR